jgi:acyl-CoA thioester hydrolase
MPRRRDLPLPDFVSAAVPAAQAEVELRVEFRDCDPMGILWHGHHLAYCEAARHELGRRIGFGLERLQELGLFAPVIRSQVLHLEPVPVGTLLRVTVELFPTEQARLYHRYRLADGDRLCTVAETEQVLTTISYEVLLTPPPDLARILQT